jgi:hypothetical protein
VVRAERIVVSKKTEICIHLAMGDFQKILIMPNSPVNKIEKKYQSRIDATVLPFL